MTINFVQRILANLPDLRLNIKIAESSWNHHLGKTKHLSTCCSGYPPNSKGLFGYKRQPYQVRQVIVLYRKNLTQRNLTQTTNFVEIRESALLETNISFSQGTFEDDYYDYLFPQGGYVSWRVASLSFSQNWSYFHRLGSRLETPFLMPSLSFPMIWSASLGGINIFSSRIPATYDAREIFAMVTLRTSGILLTIFIDFMPH